jgi:hypothetical protein
MTTSTRCTSYDSDFYAWTQQQTKALRLLQSDPFLCDLLFYLKWEEGLCLDLENLAEEIESLGRAEYEKFESAIHRLTQHLLKWQYQPELRSRSWQLTISEQRRRIVKLLRNNPSFKARLKETLSEGYADGRKSAAIEADLPLATFPETCPYPWEQLTNEDWLPE